jgi:hypothetical protein
MCQLASVSLDKLCLKVALHLAEQVFVETVLRVGGGQKLGRNEPLVPSPYVGYPREATQYS